MIDMIHLTRIFPHITLKAGTWTCVGCRVVGQAHSPLASYRSWENMLRFHVERRQLNRTAS